MLIRCVTAHGAVAENMDYILCRRRTIRTITIIQHESEGFQSNSYTFLCNSNQKTGITRIPASLVDLSCFEILLTADQSALAASISIWLRISSSIFLDVLVKGFSIFFATEAYFAFTWMQAEREEWMLVKP